MKKSEEEVKPDICFLSSVTTLIGPVEETVKKAKHVPPGIQCLAFEEAGDTLFVTRFEYAGSQKILSKS
jgi:hypothetical protein